MGHKASFFRSRRGDTLVEVLVSIAVLGIVVVGALTAIGYSRQAVARSNAMDQAGARAQQIADLLLTELTGQTQADGVSMQDGLETAAGAVCAQTPNDTDEAQFRYAYTGADANGMAGWSIVVRVRIAGPGAGYVTLRAFAPTAGGGA